MTMTLTYISKSAATTTAGDVQGIWLESLEYNEASDITGALYFGGDFFLQVLEGEEASVNTLFRKIEADPRHSDVKVVAINDLATTMFRGTPMKLIDGSHSRALQQRFVFGDLLDGGPKAANKAVFKLLRL